MYHPIKKQNLLQLAAYQKELYEKPRLRYLFLELTNRCNLNCLHCGSNCTGINDTYLDYAVIEKTLKAVSQKYDPSQILVTITGGEPFLHPNLIKIVQAAHDLGFPVGITSNGTLIDEKKARLLKYAGLYTIDISIDGIGAVHDNFRGVPNSFNKAIKGVKALKSVGIEPEAFTVAHKGNLNHLEEIYDYLNDNDFYSWRITNIDPIGRAIDNNSLLLSAKELKFLYEFIRNKRFDVSSDMEVSYGCSHFLTYEYENEVRGFYFQCGAGIMVASVMANGNIGACLDIERRNELVQGNVYRDDFVDIWENRFEIFRRDRSNLSKTCSICEYKGVCMGDSAHTWNYDKNEPIYCVASKLGG